MPIDDVQAPVVTFFMSLAERDLEGACGAWDAAGTWHVQGHHDLVGDYRRDDYIEMLRCWFDDHPDYAAQDFRIERSGDDTVVTHLATINGRFGGVATGLMIFRVSDGLIAEGWAIPTFAGGAYPF
jgi:ketosteroid isomerase-like protein